MPEKASSYQDLVVWQQSMELVVDIYATTRGWPKDELFGLVSQVRRAAISIPSNIAEGYGRETRGAYVQSLRVAQGSLKELETQILIAGRVGISAEQTTDRLLVRVESVSKMLRLLLRKLAST